MGEDKANAWKWFFSTYVHNHISKFRALNCLYQNNNVWTYCEDTKPAIYKQSLLIISVLLYEVPHRIYWCHITPSLFVEQNWNCEKHLRWQGVGKVALTQKDGTFWCLTVSTRSWEWFGYEIDAVIEELGFQSSRESVEIVFLKSIFAFPCHKWKAVSSTSTVHNSRVNPKRQGPCPPRRRTYPHTCRAWRMMLATAIEVWNGDWWRFIFSTGNLVPLELTNQSFNCGIRKKLGPVQFYSFAIIYRIKASSLEIWWSFCILSLLAEE